MAFYGRKEVEEILDQRDLILMNAFSFYADMSKENFIHLMEAAEMKANELQTEAADIVQGKYKKQNKRLVRGEINDLLHERELSKEDYLDILLFIHEKVRTKNI